MTNAYSEYYLGNLSKRLGALFEIGIDYMSIDSDEFSTMFSKSVVAHGIESGNPRYVMGMTGTEMADIVLGADLPEYRPRHLESRARWAGYIAAHAQVSFERSFEDIFESFPCSKLILVYEPLHEAPESKALGIIADSLYGECIIRRRRIELGMTQKEVAEYSDVGLPTIRAYEQGVLDLENASGSALMRIAGVLDLSIEELLKGSGRRPS